MSFNPSWARVRISDAPETILARGRARDPRKGLEGQLKLAARCCKPFSRRPAPLGAAYPSHAEGRKNGGPPGHQTAHNPLPPLGKRQLASAT